MKVFRFPFILCLWCGCTVTPAPNTDWKIEGIRGKVKSMQEYAYDSSDASNKEHLKTINKLVKFNERGYTTAYMAFESNGDINSTFISHYYGNYMLDSLFNAKGDLIGLSRKEYDKEGYVVRITSYEDNIPRYNESYTYDESHNLLEKIEYTSTSRLIRKEMYKYDGNGNVKELQEYNSAGKLEGYELYKYDEKGNKIEADYYNASGTLVNKISYRYDTLNNQIAQETNNLERHFRITYKMEYIYDNEGNWTKRTSITSDSNRHITVRAFIYY